LTIDRTSMHHLSPSRERRCPGRPADLPGVDRAIFHRNTRDARDDHQARPLILLATRAMWISYTGHSRA
jgi:hypothetical protein